MRTAPTNSGEITGWERDSMRPWLLAESNYHALRDAVPDTVVLPFGATEPHNFHLPYGTDVFEADAIAGRICELAHGRGAKVLCLPTIPYGTQTNQRGLPLAMNLMPSTLLAIMTDLIASLESSGVQKCVLLNSHGGNAFKGHLRELFAKTTVQLFLCNWYAAAKDRYAEVFEHLDDHAGEMETSLIMHLRPELVRLELANDGSTRQVRFAAVRNGWVEITRPWKRLTASSGVGDPRKATAAKGAQWFDIVTERLAEFLVELANSPVDESFPFA